MKALATNISLKFDEKERPEISLLLSISKNQAVEYVSKLREVVNKDKKLEINISQYRQKRSLDSNAYAWVLINEIANVLRTSKDEVYLAMLKLYGQSSVISVIDKAADTFRKSVKYCEDIGEADMGDRHFIHIRVYMGSSEFDTRMMSIFLDGIISDAKELNIETATENELAKMKSLWNPS